MPAFNNAPQTAMGAYDGYMAPKTEFFIPEKRTTLTRVMPGAAKILNSTKMAMESIARTAVSTTWQSIIVPKMTESRSFLSPCLVATVLMGLCIFLVYKLLHRPSSPEESPNNPGAAAHHQPNPSAARNPQTALPPPSINSTGNSWSTVSTAWTDEEYEEISSIYWSEEEYGDGLETDDDDDDDLSTHSSAILPNQLRSHNRQVQFTLPILQPGYYWSPPRSPTPYPPVGAPAAQHVVLPKRPSNAPDWFAHSQYSIWPAGSWREKRRPKQR